MINKRIRGVGGLVAAAFAGVAISIVGIHAGGAVSSAPVAGVYPDPRITPGAADTLDVAALNRRYNGLTYSQSHRKVSSATKKQVYKNAGVPYPQKAGRYEVDHFWPLCAGGSNDIKNLWLEPASVSLKGKALGFHQKDLLEAAICRKIRDGSISSEELRDLFGQFIIDWVKVYRGMKLDRENEGLKKMGKVPDLVE